MKFVAFLLCLFVSLPAFAIGEDPLSEALELSILLKDQAIYIDQTKVSISDEAKIGSLTLLDDDGARYILQVQKERIAQDTDLVRSFLRLTEDLPRHTSEEWQQSLSLWSFEKRLELASAMEEREHDELDAQIDSEGLPEEVVHQIHELVPSHLVFASEVLRTKNFKMDLIFTESDIPKLTAFVEHGRLLERIRYDNQSGEMEFDRREERVALRALYQLIHMNPNIPEGSLELITLDQSSEATADRVNILDLMASEAQHRFLQLMDGFDRFHPPMLTIKSLGKAYMLRLLQLDKQNPHDYIPAAVFRAGDGSGLLMLVCASPSGQVTFADDRIQSFRSLPQSFSYTLTNEEQLGDQASLLCGENRYDLKVKESDDDRELSFPPTLDHQNAFEDGVLKILVVYALTDSLSVEQIRRYLKSIDQFFGYKIVEDLERQERVQPIVWNDLTEAELFFAAAHQYHMGSFPISSTQSGYTATLRKTIERDGNSDLDLEVKFYFSNPEELLADTQPVVLNDEDLTDIFYERRELGNEFFMVMNLSCFSQMTLNGWMNAYKRSLSTEEAVPELSPLIIASDRGFATDPMAVLHHMGFAAQVVNSLVAEESLSEIEERLIMPMNEERGFSPVCNWQEKAEPLFSMRHKVYYLVNSIDPTQTYVF